MLLRKFVKYLLLITIMFSKCRERNVARICPELLVQRSQLRTSARFRTAQKRMLIESTTDIPNTMNTGSNKNAESKILK